MNVCEAVSAMLRKCNMSKSQLAAELGFSGPAGVLGPISKARNYGSGMKIESIIKWAHQCGYDLVLQPAGCLVDGQIVLGEEAKSRAQVKLAYQIKKAQEEASKA